MSRRPRTTRTLFVSRGLPRDNGDGGELRARQVIDGLVKLGLVAAFGVASGPPSKPPREGIEVWRTSSVGGIGGLRGVGELDWVRDPDGHPSDRWYSPAVERELMASATAFGPDLRIWPPRRRSPSRCSSGVVPVSRCSKGSPHAFP